MCKYKEYGDIIAIGDFNSRTGISEDYIIFDRLGDSSTNVLANVFKYVPDTDIKDRKSMDLVVNQFGRRLLSFCKTSGKFKDFKWSAF